MHISQQLMKKEPDNILGNSIMCFGAVASDMESSNYYRAVNLYSSLHSSTMRPESVPQPHHLQSYVAR